jgi:hypothetical protein
MTIDLNPTVAGQTWKLNIISRVSPGDNFNSAQVILGGADEKFGPQAQPGKWATYKVPFLNSSGFANGSALQVGMGKYYGSIAGTSLKVTKTVSGMNVQGSSYLSGAGITPGTASSTGTYAGTTPSPAFHPANAGPIPAVAPATIPLIRLPFQHIPSTS